MAVATPATCGAPQLGQNPTLPATIVPHLVQCGTKFLPRVWRPSEAFGAQPSKSPGLPQAQTRRTRGVRGACDTTQDAEAATREIQRKCYTLDSTAEVAELADAPALGAGGRKAVGVRVPSSALFARIYLVVIANRYSPICPSMPLKRVSSTSASNISGFNFSSNS